MHYLTLLALLFAVELFYFRLADRLNIIDKPNLRSSHTQITIRGGGVVFLAGAWLYMLFFGFRYEWFLSGLTIIAAISFADDIRPLSNRIRLCVHFTAIVLLLVEWGFLTQETIWLIPLALFVCAGVINAYNFMDGINGITGCYSLAVFAPLFLVNRTSEFVDPAFIGAVALSIGVFLFFNFRKQARCFAGDVGSVSIAFCVIFLLGSLILKTGDASYLVLLAVYGVDSICTIIHRLILHENIFKPHRKHAYQLLANELKLPHTAVATIYMVLQLVISLGAIWLPINGWIYLGGVLTILVVGYVILIKRYFYLHLNYLKSTAL